MKKRMFWMLGMLVLLMLLPTVAGAVQIGATGDIAVNRGGSALIFFGTNHMWSTADNGKWEDTQYRPIAWRVMVKDTDNITLLSDRLIGCRVYNDSTDHKSWSGSDIANYLNSTGGYKTGTDKNAGFKNGDSFTNAEGAAQVASYGESEDTNGHSNIDISQTFVLPSYEEVNGWWNSDDDRIAKYASNGYPGNWWLRSPVGNDSDAVVVASNGAGYSDGAGVLNNYGIRPAFKLNLASVIFTSAAAGGKSGDLGTLEAAQPPTGDMKLTVLDSNTANLSLSAATAQETSPGTMVSINYSGAKTGTNKYVSCVLELNGVIKYYGKLSQKASDTVDIALPDDIPAGYYTLRLFNEQINGDNLTDYACKTIDIWLKVGILDINPPPAPTGFTVSASANPAQGGKVSGGGSYTSGSTATLQATANSGYTFTGWTVNGAAAGSANPLSLTIAADTSVVANFEEIYTGEENTYPDPVNGSQTATVDKNNVAVISLMTDNARSIVGQPGAKGKPGTRVARLNANTGKAKALRLRMSADGLAVLKNAKIDAFELCTGVGDIYLDKQMLTTIYDAASASKATYRLHLTPSENGLSLLGDLGEKNPQQKGKGLLTIRLPLEDAASVANTPSFYDRQKKELVLAPAAYGSFTLTKRAENKHWAADYMAFAKISGQPDDTYQDKAGKTYTRAEFAQKLYDERAKDDALPTALRAAYPFKDTASRAAVVLQQAGIISPLSTGLFNGSAALTNAQAAAWLARLDWLEIDPLSPYGWAFSDDGVSMYYGYTGKMAAGKTTVGGKAYTFDKDGFLTM